MGCMHGAQTPDGFENLRIERDDRGVLTVVLDVAGRPVNVMDEGLLRDLGALLPPLERDRTTRLVVFRSGKKNGFLAGADLTQLRQMRQVEEAESLLRAGQRLFDRVAALAMPTVAAIHGACLGGGLEFALACRYRVARDEPSARVGLPETQLGLIPAWGGTQRLPEVVGLAAALRMILDGSRLSPSTALETGLVDLTTAPHSFDEDLRAFIDDRLAGKPVPRVQQRGVIARLRDRTPIGRRLVLHAVRRQYRSAAADNPALPAAIRAIETGLRYGRERGLSAEREEFCKLLFNPACRTLLDRFFERQGKATVV